MLTNKKELGLGLYDALSGLVTQPIDGGKREGALGVAKGIGWGFGGLVLKPIAGMSYDKRKSLELSYFTNLHRCLGRARIFVRGCESRNPEALWRKSGDAYGDISTCAGV